MCGRYTFKTDRSKIEKQFDIEELPAFPPRYNLAPTQDGLVIRAGESFGRRTAAVLRWGLIPPWTKDRTNANGWINARSETAASKPSFRNAFRKRRCLVLADGFYEWDRRAKPSRPYHFTVNHGEPFAMAGLWERWEPAGSAAVETFTILTIEANELLAAHHDRMPVILDPDWYDDWINPLLVDSDAIKRMLRPCPSSRMLARAVDSRVNNIHFDDPQCLDPPSGARRTLEPGSRENSSSAQRQLDFDLPS